MSAPVSKLEAIRDAIVDALRAVTEFAPLTIFDGTDAVTVAGTLIVGVGVNGLYTARGTHAGKPFYNRADYPSNYLAESIYWNPDSLPPSWRITNDGGADAYHSNDAAATPDAAVTWVSDDYPHPLPVVTAGPGAVTDSSILAWKKGDKIQGTTARIKSLGVAVVVMVTSAKESGEQSEQAFFDRVPVMISITEKVIVNQSATGSQLSALYIAERCVAALKNRMLSGLQFEITTDPHADTIQDGNPFRSLFIQDDASAFNTQFVNLVTKTASEQRS